jgi:hypothetical protein
LKTGVDILPQAGLDHDPPILHFLP